MIGVILYTLIEFLNYYLAYKNVFGIQFTKKKLPYVIAIISACMVQIIVLYLVDNTWRDIVATAMGLFAAIIVTKSKKWKTLLLYPIATFLPSLINIVGSYGVADLWGITQEAVSDSIVLTLLSECTAVIVFIFYDIIVRKRNRNREELSLTVGQYLILFIGVICFFLIVAFSQGILRDEFAFMQKWKNRVAIACVVIALLFMVLSIWQQVTWKKAFRYRMDNEKYELFLAGQEEHIRSLILEDERRRKLRHDMNAHMLALDMMVQKEEWEQLRAYLHQMKETLGETNRNQYTMISAVDAIIHEWHMKAMQCQAEWLWQGTIKVTDEISIFEWCTIFSNLLSNAVEAIEKQTDGGRIEVNVFNIHEKNTIIIKNTCANISTFDKRPKTTKEDKLFHGLGLKNVEEIVKKHEGSIDYVINDGWFQVEIVL